MKKILILILTLFILSCNKEDEEITPPLCTYQFSTNEIELLNRINNYRDSVNLNTLQINQHISYVCYGHNVYMIDTGIINHNYFQQRVNNLQETLGAERVGENIGYNYQNTVSVLNAWLSSYRHKENIEGDYTDFGLSITRGTNQRNYITLILIKK
jgi:uncharacterized protein YkwD